MRFEMRRWLAICVFAMFTGGLGACATTSVNKTVKFPPKHEKMRNAERIAVIDFDGHHEYASEATRRIREAIHERKLHTLVELQNRARRKALEQRAAWGEAVGVKGSQGPTVVLQGEATSPDYHRSYSHHEEEVCVRENKKGECIETKRQVEYTLHEECEAGVYGKVTDVKSGNVILEETVTGYGGRSETLEGRRPMPNEDQVCGSAFSDSVSKFIPYVTPVVRRMSLEFYEVEDPAGLTNKGIKAVRKSRLKRALNMFKDALRQSGLTKEQVGQTRYNLAMVYMIGGEFDACRQQAQKGLKLQGDDARIIRLQEQCQLYAD